MTIEVAATVYSGVVLGAEKAAELAVDAKDKVVEVSSNLYNAASQKIAEGYQATKNAVVSASHVVTENAAYAAEKVK